MLSRISWDLATAREDGTALAPGELAATILIISGKEYRVEAPKNVVTFEELGLVNGVYTVAAVHEDSAGRRSNPTGEITFRVGDLPAPKAPANLRVV